MQSVSLCHRLFKKLNFIKIWQVKVGQNKDLVCCRQKQSFRQCAWGLRQLVLKPGFRPKGRALGIKKSQKISTASDQCFLSYVKKLRGVGGSNSQQEYGQRILVCFKILKFFMPVLNSYPHKFPIFLFLFLFSTSNNPILSHQKIDSLFEKVCSSFCSQILQITLIYQKLVLKITPIIATPFEFKTLEKGQ